MQSVLQHKLSQHLCPESVVPTLAAAFKPLISQHLSLTQTFQDQQTTHTVHSYTFACEKRVLWDSKVDKHVKECLVVQPQPQAHFQHETFLTIGTTLAGIAILPFNDRICCNFCPNAVYSDMEQLVVHYTTQHLHYDFAYHIRWHQHSASDRTVEFIVYCKEGCQESQLNSIALQKEYGNKMEHGLITGDEMKRVMEARIGVLKDGGVIARIECAVTRVMHVQLRRQQNEIAKMQNLQGKYVVERNLNKIFHDPETGLPRLKEYHERNQKAADERQRFLEIEVMTRKIKDAELPHSPLNDAYRCFMLRWNTFAMNYTPKNLSDSVKCQELLNGFIHKYRIADSNIDSPDETPKVKRLMIASLLQRLYQNSLISVECVVSSLEQFQE